jgi:hypothetical protein
MSVGAYGVPVFWAKATDPVRSVTSRWGAGSGSFRCPDNAVPADGSDGHLVICQPDGSVDEMWQPIRQANQNWKAGTYNHLPPGAHTYPGEVGCRGSSFSLLAGCVTPDEFKADAINHKLSLVLPTPTVRAAYVEPSLSSDGTNDASDSLPEGALLVLDPAFDVSGLSANTRPIAKALQAYGGYVVDKTGAANDLSVLAVDRKTWTATGQADPWAGYPNYVPMNDLLTLIPRMKVAAFVGFKKG